MAQFRKILLSGSNVHVSEVTASNIPQATDNNTILFADSSGIVRTLSNLTYNSSQTTIEFAGGTFSGSFSGDGSGLTGVTATLGNSLADGAGIVDFTYDGGTARTASLDLHPAGGLTFFDGNTDSGTSTGAGKDDFKLGLTSSLAGNGLEFPTANDYSEIQINLDGNSNSTSGLKLGSSGLAISDNIDGSGLGLSSGVLSVDLATNSGLEIESNKLKLNDTLDGTGLNFATGNTILNIDSSVVVDNANTITFATGSTNVVITVTSDGSVSDVTAGKSALLIDNPVLSMNLSDTLTGNFTFNDDVTISGDLLVEGGGSEVNLEVQNLNIADQFILVNSGSTSGDGGLVVQNGSGTTGAFLFYDGSHNRWGVSNDSQTMTDTGHEVHESNHAAVVTVQPTTDAESTILASNPLFGTAANNSRVGQIVIKTNQSTNESSAFIYA